MGGHHIGSTVLGVTLGNCADFFFGGELHCYLTRRGVPAQKGEEAMALWRAVGEHVENAAELFGHETELYLDRSSALRRLHKWPMRRRLRPRYRRINEDLYRAIGRVAGVSYIVDTSHYPLRARELQAFSGIDLYLLFLVREPQAVVASHDPRNAAWGSKSALTTNLHLWATHLLSLLVFLRHPRERRLFIRHEQFLADPEGVIRQILDCVDSPAEMPDFTSLKTGYPLQGNPFLEKSQVIALKGPSSAPTPRSRMTALLQLPWVPVFSRLRPAVASREPSGAPASPEQAVASGSNQGPAKPSPPG
jgi:hypothetical protein